MMLPRVDIDRCARCRCEAEAYQIVLELTALGLVALELVVLELAALGLVALELVVLELVALELVAREMLGDR